MLSPQKRLRLRMRRLKRRLRHGSDRLLMPTRRLRARLFKFRRQVTTRAGDGLMLLGGFLRAIERAQRRRRRSMAKARAVGAPGERAAVGPSVESATVAPMKAEEERPEREVADERTIRRTAEHQQGGMSTEEMHIRYESGLNPGGLHGRATKPPPDSGEGKVRESPHAHAYDEEPTDPKLRRPGHSRQMSSKRAGA